MSFQNRVYVNFTNDDLLKKSIDGSSYMVLNELKACQPTETKVQRQKKKKKKKSIDGELWSHFFTFILELFNFLFYI